MGFELVSDFSPQGDQGQAIEKLCRSIEANNMHQTLLGVTGSGKTYTMAQVIARQNRPTLIMSHNKTLAAQLFSEFKNFFPNNSVEYFVSYFDYYQPEAYIPRTDTYIEKDSSVNDEIERLRLSAMGALLSRRDVIVVASVSCIYGLGSPEDYSNMVLNIYRGQQKDRDVFLRELVEIIYERNDLDFARGQFRVRGDVVEVHPADMDEQAVRVEFFGDDVERLSVIESLTGRILSEIESFTFYPAKQFVTSADKIAQAMVSIREEMRDRVAFFEKNNQLVEAQRIKMRTEYDLEMMRELGYCNGIENYSRHLTGRPPGSRPYTLLDFFPKDYLTIIDESHVSVPQIGGMYEGDKSRKTTLVEHGFRLPSALDNRPLKFDEFMQMTNQRLYVSATPATFELLNSYAGNDHWHVVTRTGRQRIPSIKITPEQVRISGAAEPVDAFEVSKKGAPLVIEQVIRPTGLLDPHIHLRPLDGQIDATIELCRERIERGQRVLVTTLTKRTAEDLTEYLRDLDLQVRYLHSDIDALERVEILRELRQGDCDVLVGINLLREGLDLPEVSLVCILDADKEGFLRSETSLVQTAGRAARHIEGEVYLFADQQTESIRRLVTLSERRRQVQGDHNTLHGIEPQSVRRSSQHSLHTPSYDRDKESVALVREESPAYGTTTNEELMKELRDQMLEASAKLEFERAAILRDQISKLEEDGPSAKKTSPLTQSSTKSSYGKSRAKKSKKVAAKTPKA